MSQKKIKITDVAEYAGVSVSTVSLVLGNKGRISEATINKVNDAIKPWVMYAMKRRLICVLTSPN
ncbi:maltose regulon regulatory protein MalI [Photobacterium aphoticum]|uniref:Maltose regulon regulatory protein MalI n=1 Tax=Photobacterium aphoticum TaxID=754436 RepID=A0A090QQS4_9GAMM|nr:maltose regulon regulatory protein MalI [Photobacterium aphoticum]